MSVTTKKQQNKHQPMGVRVLALLYPNGEKFTGRVGREGGQQTA